MDGGEVILHSLALNLHPFHVFFLTRGNHPSIIVWVVFNEGWGEYKAAEVNQSDI